jgi:twinkle protein
MKYQSSNTKAIFTLEFGTKKQRHLCPECSANRRKGKSEKCLEYYPDTNRAYCFHCNTTYFEYNPHLTTREYIIPEWKNITALTDKAVHYFTGRMISQETLTSCHIYSDTEFMPQLGRPVEVICFPYMRDGRVVNIKYRGPQKTFKLTSGAELILWNHDALKTEREIIITEGEIDALSFWTVGMKNVVSVPNGASINLEYMDGSIHFFEAIDTAYIAVDNDSKGIILRDELIRRIGPEKCKIVNFRDCKDANEFLCKYGSLELQDAVRNARYFPVKGIITVDDFYSDLVDLFKNGVQRGETIGDENIDKFISWETGRLAVVTGIPGSGKSEFVDYIVTRLNIRHQWKAAYFTPENYPLKFHYAKLYEKLIGKKFSSYYSREEEFDQAAEYIRSNFFYILHEEDFTSEGIIRTAKGMVKTHGIKILVIDPYNKIEHKYTDTETQYISRFLDMLTIFAKMNDVLVFLVAHPRKMQKNNSGKYEVPSLYDISGSANFYNKTDYGFCVHRTTDENNIMQNTVEVYWQKIKFKHLGEQGVTDMKYNYVNGRFETGGGDIHTWDNTNWLVTPDAKDRPIDFWGALQEKSESPF